MRRAQTAGGIVIPSNIPDPQAYGRVMSVGELIPPEIIKEGDILVMHINAGMDMPPPNPKSKFATISPLKVFAKIKE